MKNFFSGRFRPGAMRGGGLGAALLLLLAVSPGAPTFNWDTNRNRVSADIKATQLRPLLEQIAAVTGWHILLEPDTTCDVSAKFENLPPGEALRLLFRDLNFALVPDTNASPRLFVFRTALRNATQSIPPARAAESASQGKLIPNELILRLKPGAKIDELARLLGAKVTGRIDSLNAYRLQFPDAAAAEAARQQLATLRRSFRGQQLFDQRAGRTAAATSCRRRGLLKPPPTTGASSWAWWIRRQPLGMA